MDSKAYQDIPARRVDFPTSVSEAARASLAFWSGLPSTPPPALDDVEGWRERAQRSDAGVAMVMGSRVDAARASIRSELQSVDGVPCYICTPTSATQDDRVMLDIHGGGFTSGAGVACEAYGIVTAASFDVLTYAVDYRMPPDHPYPAALDDCIAVYRFLLGRHAPDRIVVRGISAGGNLAAALMLRARAESLPLPAGLLLLTPELDLTESGDSFQTNADTDVVLKGSLMQANLLYAGGADLADPYLSPLFGSFGEGFPPTLTTAGTRDLFLSNAARMHNALRRAGQHSELIIEEAMPHGGFFGTREDALLQADVVDFANRAWRQMLAAG